MHLGELKAKPVEELLTIAEGMGIENLSRQKNKTLFSIFLKLTPMEEKILKGKASWKY